MSRDTPVGYSSTVMHAAAAMIGPLQRRGSASTAYLAEAAGVAETTAHRSLRFLRECGAPLKFNRSKLAWTLEDPAWSLPLFRLCPAGWVAEIGEARC